MTHTAATTHPATHALLTHLHAYAAIGCIACHRARTSKPAKKSAAKPRLTAEQRARVRSLMDDEGQTRAEAVAWVLAFEPAEVSP